MLLISTLILSSVAITVVAFDKQKLGKAEVLKIVNNSNEMFARYNRMFTQLPAPPGDPMPLPLTSHSPYGWRCHEDFWDITSPICDIHWWGFTTTYIGGIYYPSDPEGMTFNIVFYENDNGMPGDVICSYIKVKPSFYPTGIMYDYSEYPEAEGLYELFYFTTSLDLCCDLSEGWVSIQSIYSPTDSDFSWIESLYGNNNSLQYGWGNWYIISNFAYILTDADADPIPDIICEGNLNWKNVDQGSKVTGNFSVENIGDSDSILHWKIESFPNWGSNWSFTPSASILTPEEGPITVEVEVNAPEKSKRFRGKIKIVNAEDSSDYCEISVNLQTSLNYLSKNLVPINLPYRIINSFPSKFKLPIKCLDKGFVVENKDNFVPGEFIVKLIYDINMMGPSITHLNEKYKISSIEKAFRNFENPIFDNIYVLKVPKDSDILSIVKDYSSFPDVIYAVPNYIAYSSMVPNDPCFNLQWALHNTGQTAGTPDADIDAPETWDIEIGDEDIIITISDSGVDWDHPDLAAKIWINSDEILDGTDNDGNGFIDDIRGWDFVNNDNNPTDDNGHGTCCAGIASAVTDNNIGMAGICWNCRIMPVKGLNQGGSGTYQDLAEGIIYAADNGADIISMSWGGSSSPIMEDAIDYAYSQGVALIAAAHNYHSDSKIYPAAYDNVISVAATYYNDEKMYFSNFGSWVDVAAPGYDIYTTALDDNYTICFTGTSAATPHVAGVTGLILSKNPGFNSDEIQTILRSTTDPVLSNQYIGIGRINVYKAIQRDTTPIANLNSSLDEATIFSEVSINGTASGTYFEDYIVCYGVGIYPDDWIVIHESSDPVVDGVLATWEPPLDLEETTFSIRLMVHDTFDQITEDRAIVYVNLPPNTPKIEGPSKGGPGKYTYTFVTTDPNDDDVYYFIDWGDGDFENWIGPYESGEKCIIDHSWSAAGSFTIKVKAKDIYDAESDWGTFPIIIPRNSATYNSLLKWIIDRFQLIGRFLLLIY